MVYSGEWRAYNQEGNIPGLDHSTVSHLLFFVDLVTSVHTQMIESYWNWIKTKLKTIKGVPWIHVVRTNLMQFVARSPGSIRCKKQFTPQTGSFRSRQVCKKSWPLYTIKRKVIIIVKQDVHTFVQSFYFSKFYFKQDPHTSSSQTIPEMGESCNIGVSYTTPWGRGVSYNLQ